MRQKIKAACFLVVGIFITLSSFASVQALVLQTVDTEFKDISPLIVTSFMTSSSGSDLEFVELYNNGKVPLSLSDWSVDVAQADGGVKYLDLAARAGYIEPNTHVVLAKKDVVQGATYSINGWAGDDMPTQPIAEIRLMSVKYRPHVVTVDAKKYDNWMIRTYNTSSYSDATSAMHVHADTERSLFDDGLYVLPVNAGGLKVVEIYPYAKDCTPFDVSVECRDYVKLVNSDPSEPVDLSGYVLRTDSSSATRTSSNTVNLNGLLWPGEYMTVSLTNSGAALSLTNSGGYVWLEDVWGFARYDDTLAHYDSATSLMQGQAYAMTDTGEWSWTTTPAPYTANKITLAVDKSCLEGSVINPVTNRCNKLAAASSLAACKEGQERNPETNRCRSVLAAADTRKPCKDTQYRSEETGRCRNLPPSGVPDAAFAVTPTEQTGTQFVGWWALGGVCAMAVGYAVWEWRDEIKGVFRRIARK